MTKNEAIENIVNYFNWDAEHLDDAREYVRKQFEAVNPPVPEDAKELVEIICSNYSRSRLDTDDRKTGFVIMHAAMIQQFAEQYAAKEVERFAHGLDSASHGWPKSEPLSDKETEK